MGSTVVTVLPIATSSWVSCSQVLSSSLATAMQLQLLKLKSNLVTFSNTSNYSESTQFVLLLVKWQLWKRKVIESTQSTISNFFSPSSTVVHLRASNIMQLKFSSPHLLTLGQNKYFKLMVIVCHWHSSTVYISNCFQEKK